MHSDDTPPSSDPLFGNAASELLRGAAGTDRQPPSDPRFWEPPAPEELQARLEGYIVEAFLARGGMGAVYRGMQTSLERPVAIKILPPQLSEHDASFAQRFKQEARAMAQLNHPGIVKVYDFGEMSDGTLYFVMEYVEGTDVAKMVASQGRLSSAHAMAITAHVCDALQYAHQLGIIHRDIKPANIMVSTDGAVKVADFGLAKSFNSTHTTFTMTGHVMGTLHFMAPEALMLGSAVDHRADIYAVGVMLYQMLTGRLPQGMFEMPSLLVPGMDPRYDAIIAYAMRENRDMRYQTVYDMRCALNAILTQPVVQVSALPQATVQQQTTAAARARNTARPPRPGQLRPPQGVKQAPVMKKKSSAAIWLIAAIVVLGLGGMVWMQMGKSEPQSESAPQPALVSPYGPIGDLVFPTAQFEKATISECVEYFQIKSRDLDPAKKGVTFLVDEATRNSNASISFDLKEIRVADLIECFARVARLEVNHVGEAVQLKTSPSVKPPFPIGTPTKKLLQLGETIFPTVKFNKAKLEEACEYLRVKPKDLSWGQHVNLIIDPDFTQRKHEITLDLTQVPLSDALAYITQMCNAEVTYMADAIYIQPRSPSAGPSPLKIGTPTAKLQKMGETIFPIVQFEKATIQEACEYVRIKGRETSGQPVNLIIDPMLAQQNHEISIWAPRVSLSAALSYIADLCDAEVAYLAEAFYLQPRSTKLQNLDPWAVQSFGEAGKVIFPNVNFQNATIEEAAEFIRLKSRDLDPQKKGMVILLDEAACRAAGKITLDSQNITAANAIAQIAVTAGLEIFRVGDAARLRAPAKPKTSASAPAKPAAPPSATAEQIARFTFDSVSESGKELADAVQHDGILELDGIYKPRKPEVTLKTPDLDYRRFTVAVRLQPDEFGNQPNNWTSTQNTLLVAGRSGRWFAVGVRPDGRLHFGLDGLGFANSNAILTPGEWVTLAVTCDQEARKAELFLNGKSVAKLDIKPDAKLNVIGTQWEKSDKEWLFVNYGNGNTLKGAVDELVLYNGVLTANQIADLKLGGENQQPPRIRAPLTRLAKLSLQRIPTLQLTNASLTEALALLKAKALALGPPNENLKIIVDPALDAEAKRITMDAADIPLAELLQRFAGPYNAWVNASDDSFTLIPRR